MIERFEQLKLDPEGFEKTVGFFFGQPSGVSIKRSFGEILVKEHGWAQKKVTFSSSCITQRKSQYFAFINPNHPHLADTDFSDLNPRCFYGFDGEIIAKGFRTPETRFFEKPNAVRSRTSEIRRQAEKDKEMQAQKILGEGVFNMVLKNRETFFQRIQQ